MASIHLLLLTITLLSTANANAPKHIITKKSHGKFKPGPWKSAHATFYGGPSGSDTTAGSCGYENTISMGYGTQTTAISSALYDDGKACGSCYEIRCESSAQGCKPGHQSITVTATNWCPPGGWCSLPHEHFDLTMPAFLQIGEYKAGIIPVSYRRVPCEREGGIRFTINGNRYFNLVLVWNVGGAGDVEAVWVKSNKLPWTQMKRNWGQHWQCDKDLTGQSLSFRVKTSDKRKSTSWNITPRDWQFGQTFEGKNFKH